MGYWVFGVILLVVEGLKVVECGCRLLPIMTAHVLQVVAGVAYM